MTRKSLLAAVILAVFAGTITISGVAWALEDQDLSSSAAKSKQLITKDSTKPQALKPAPEKLKAAAPLTMAELVPPGFNDDTDDSSLPYLLTPAELRKFGIRRASQEIPTFDPKTMIARERVSPVLKVRIQAVLTADPEGSYPATITPAQIKQLVDQANRVWWSSGIEFLFDPEKDVTTRSNVLVHHRVPLDDFEQNKANPDWDVDDVDASANHNARTYVALEIPEKLVVFFAHSFGYVWDEAAQEWYLRPAGGFSGYDLEYVFMPNGMPEKNLLAHEIGHYLHLPHPFVTYENESEAIITVEDASQAIKDWVENQGHAPKQGPLVFDADSQVRFPSSHVDIKDTPPDPDGQIFNSTYESGAKCMEDYDTIVVPVLYSNGKQVVYELKPDRLNVMSYYKGCHNLGTHHVSDGQIAASRNALINGNRLHLLRPTIERRPTMQQQKSST